ncbi:hypothetical protein GQ457_09G028200 [Hibiscus cannabinus]
MTKIVGTLGPNSRSVEIISGCLKAGMSGSIFRGVIPNFTKRHWENLKTAVKCTKKLCATMLDTGDTKVVLTPDQDKEASSNLLPINFHGLYKFNIFSENLILLQNILNKTMVRFDQVKSLFEEAVKWLTLFYLVLAAAVKKGDTIFIGQYLFTGNETTSVWLESREKVVVSLANEKYIA